MAKTLLDMMNRVLLYTGRAQIDAETLDGTLNEDQAMVRAMINDRYRQMAEEWTWNELNGYVTFETTDSQAIYTINGQVIDEENDERDLIDNIKSEGMMLESNVDERRFIYELTPQEFNQYLNPDSSGTPRFYRTRGETDEGDPIVELWPTPGDAEEIRVEYVAQIEDLTNSADIPKLPADPIVRGAILSVRVYDDDDRSQIREARQEYRRQLFNARGNSRTNKNYVRGGDVREGSTLTPHDTIDLPIEVDG